MMKTPLVSIEKGNHYRRFVGKTVNNHVVSDRPLSGPEVEMFRKYPAAFIQPDEPEVA